MKKKLNELTGSKWLQYSFSIWRDIEKNNEERTLKHPAMFPIQLAERLIDIFTNKENKIIFDPFSGSGSTIIAALKKNKEGIGFEINKEYVAMTKRRIRNVYFKNQKKLNFKIYNTSIFNLEKYIKNPIVDLCITSPPYWDVLNMKRSADKKEIRPYSTLKNDLGNIKNYSEFLKKLQNAFLKVKNVIKENRYLIVIVMDIRKKSKFYPFHIDTINILSQIGFNLKDIIIWDRQKEYNNMRPLGYPTTFIVNKVHEYILIFKKE